MYLVLMVRENRVLHVGAFRNSLLAEVHADNLVRDQVGVIDEMPDWENGEYSTVFTGPDGISIMIKPCDEPEAIDERFQCHLYGVKLV